MTKWSQAFLLAAALAVPGSGASSSPRVLRAPYSGIIQPVAAEFIEGGVRRAEDEDFDAFLLELDTPGGLDPSMRRITKAIMNAKVPVIVYVHPTGSRAASAGVFITMSAHLAVMTPGTNIGAAHPVQLGGGGGGTGKGEKKPDEAMEAKVVNDAGAYLKSIAEKRGRNETWAFKAVSASTSIPASEAVAIGVVDFVAKDRADLFEKAHGRTLPDFKKPLRLKGAEVVDHKMTRRQRWLSAIADPNVAMILMSLGAGGLFIELYNPGLILPGIVGAVCLLLAFYSLETLSASYAGVLLILVGMAFFLLEIKVTSYGMLALGGVVAVLLGILMLFQNSMGGIAVSTSVIAGSIAGLLGVTALISFVVVQAYKRKTTTGTEGMVGLEGTAMSDLGPEGTVMVMGEIWKAEAVKDMVPKGGTVVVSAVKGMLLRVRRK